MGNVYKDALGAGASIGDALNFTNIYQVEALRRGVSVEGALQFTNEYQIMSFVFAEATVGNALKINTDTLYKALVNYAEENAGEVGGFFEEHYSEDFYGSVCSGLELLGYDEILGCIKSPSIYDSLVSE